MSQITIIVPCYNVELYIEKAIVSFSRQTFKNFEVIFVDDCSTDKSVETIKRLIEKYSIKASIIINKINSGPSYSRKIGIDMSNTEYVAFCDSDDWLDERFLEEMYLATDKGNKDIAFCNYRLVYDDGRSIDKKSIKPNNEYNSLEDYVVADMDGVCGGIFRRTLFENMVFPEIRNGEDMAIIPVLISKAKKIGTTEKCIYNYFQRKGSLSTAQTKKLIEGIRNSFLYIFMNMSLSLYYSEIEYLGIRNLLYGALLNLFKQGYDTKTAYEILCEFEQKFPHWEKNKYINNLPAYKKLYLFFIKRKIYLGTYILSKLHTKLTK